MRRVGEAFTEEVEDAIIESQLAFMRAEFGEERAGGANVGWGIDEFAGEVQTKVYGDEPVVVTSYMMADGEVQHDVEDY